LFKQGKGLTFINLILQQYCQICFSETVKNDCFIKVLWWYEHSFNWPSKRKSLLQRWNWQRMLGTTG